MNARLQRLFRRGFGLPVIVATATRSPASIVTAALAVALSLSPVALRAAEFVPDEGHYRVYQQDRLLGVERIVFRQNRDSLVMTSTIEEHLPNARGQQDTLIKTAILVRDVRDGLWRSYHSDEQVNRENRSRTLSVSDSTYTSSRESSEGGFGDTYERPPGRVYVVDPQVFALFDVLCRDMHSQSFDERPVTMLYLMARDTAVTARVKRLGKAPFKFGSETIVAEKFSITDPWSEFFAWVSPKGRMLRLTLPAVGLRVERDPGPVKPGHPVNSTVGPKRAAGPVVPATPATPGR